MVSAKRRKDRRRPHESNSTVTIVGGGIVGICCALSLLEKGAGVRLIERDEPGQGTSLGNAGVISP
ncbi:MAG: FAD-dependent oxidoreductase, partial [Alphaproteobacteria bacterium]|nr:FAD-dependent oxidoreductase [Alphaproteobacteria bacterium]